jgi:membrane-associated phospholipid phosphatase
MPALRWAVLLLAIASFLTFFVLAVLAHGHRYFDLDHVAHDLARSAQHPTLKSLMQVVSDLGSGWALLPLSLAAFAVLRQTRHRIARFVPFMVGGSYLVFALTKLIVARPRPRLTPYGFPSAHTFGAVVFYGGLIYVLWTIELRPFWRWTGTVFLTLLIVGIGLSRIYLRSHWLSDVLGGVTGGTALLLFFLLAVDPRLRPWRSSSRGANPPARS